MTSGVSADHAQDLPDRMGPGGFDSRFTEATTNVGGHHDVVEPVEGVGTSIHPIVMRAAALN